MAWTNSRVFRRYLAHMIGNVVAFDFDLDTIKVALYNDSITPDNDVVTDALMSYNGAASQWLTANEVTSTGQWNAGGVTLAGKSIDVGTADVVFIDASDSASAAGATLSATNGCLVYDEGLTPDMGLCYNYFGGPNSVTNGTFTVIWNANGIYRMTMT